MQLLFLLSPFSQIYSVPAQLHFSIFSFLASELKDYNFKSSQCVWLKRWLCILSVPWNRTAPLEAGTMRLCMKEDYTEVSHTEVSAHTSTVSSQRSARKPKTWEPLLWLFLLLNLLSDGRSAGSRGILKERLLASLNRKDDLHVLFSYSILLIIFNILFAEAIFHLLFRKRKRFLETPLFH